MGKLSLLIVDDESAAREGLRRALSAAYEIVVSEDGKNAWETIQSVKPDLVLLDLNMPRMGGFQVLEKAQTLDSAPLMVMITAYGSERIAVEAMKLGAYDYVTKPFKLDELRLLLSRASEKIRLEKENKRLREATALESYFLVGNSQDMQRVNHLIDKVASTDVTVLITGESGTGKELVASTIHRRGNRKDGPFIAVNCAALPGSLIESELFGYKKGAFTGANRDKPGKFELAQGGTLFLDEIGDMSLDTQSKVLRTIENRSVTALGSSLPVKVDVRIIVATNQILEALIDEGKFRQDLYYRVRVVEMPLPPLRHRGPDTLLLANHFLSLYAAKHDKDGLALTSSMQNSLMNHNWPGNIRELRNLMESLVILTTDRGKLDESVLSAHLKGPSLRPFRLDGRSFKEAKQTYVKSVESSLIIEALKETKGNISKASHILGMKRQHLQQKLRQLKITAADFKQ